MGPELHFAEKCIYLLIDAIFIWILQVLKNDGIYKRLYLFSVISCITENMVKSPLVPDEKFIEFL